jgi:hypothetical protein
LTLVIGRIEAEGGTVDKLMGDGVMAFWNAPERQPDHAARALRAALAIRERLLRVNLTAVHPVKLRIGLHTGPTVVGNVGSPSRLSYTIVGDTVNVASRVEKAGKDLLPDAEVAVLLSAATAEAVGPTAPPCDPWESATSAGARRPSSCSRHRRTGRCAPRPPARVSPGPAGGQVHGRRPRVTLSPAAASTAEEVLAFWFGPEAEGRWFASDAAFDALLEQRLGASPPPRPRAASTAGPRRVPAPPSPS